MSEWSKAYEDCRSAANILGMEPPKRGDSAIKFVGKILKEIAERIVKLENDIEANKKYPTYDI